MSEAEKVIMIRFVLELIEEEWANGADVLAKRYQEILDKDFEGINSVEELAGVIFGMYFEHCCDAIDKALANRE